MSKVTKLALGVVTIGTPLLIAVLGVVQYGYVRRCIDEHVHGSFVLWLLMLPCILTLCGLQVFYQVHSRKSSCIPREKKALWLGMLMAFHVLVYPVYWYRFIWKDNA